MTTLKPTAPIPANGQVVTVEDLVFGGDPAERARCAITNRRFEFGSGALPFEQQTAMFLREAALAERKAAIEQQAAAAAAPKLRLVSTFANARIEDFKTGDPVQAPPKSN